MVLPVLVRRHSFEALDEIRFPEGKAANVLRGGFGTSLRAVATTAVYERIFEPRSNGSGPSGLADPPRPFLFRAWRLDGKLTAKHDDFEFDVHIFGDPAHADIITAALENLFDRGAGVGRGRARLVGTEDLYIDASLTATEPATRVRVCFITPTELKHQGSIVRQPDFHVLIRRVRDRISALLSLYGPGELNLDHRMFGEFAEEVRTIRKDLDLRDIARRSSRTGQIHQIGGMVGAVEYAGPLGSFVPFLRAAYYTGVGRHTVWGNGCIETEVLPALSPESDCSK
jgi:hypothetical protein